MKRKSILMMTAIALMTVNFSQVALGEPPKKDKEEIIEQIEEINNGDETIYFEDDDTEGTNVFITGLLSEDNFKATRADVLKYIEENKALFEFTSDKSNFKVEDIEKDDLGFTHVKLSQTFDNKVVYEKNMTIHFDAENNVVGMTGNVENKIENIENISTSSISADKAIEIAKNSKTFTELTEDPKSEEYIIYKDNKAYDVYKVNIVYDDPEYGSWEIFIDKYNGTIIDEVSNIREGSFIGQGLAVNGTTRKLTLNFSKNKYYLQNTAKNVNTYTANYVQTTYGKLMAYNSSYIDDTAAVSAHSYAEVVYDFYKNMFNRDSLDGQGMAINSVIHYGRNYVNAFWNGYKMIYGDGDGKEFTCFSGDLDVVGHEMTHGVTSNTCDLAYENQSGALNESMSDIFGVLIQTYDKYDVANGGTWRFNPNDWVVGDEIYTPQIAGDALRSLADPTLYEQPAHMNNYENLPNTDWGDNGGVHVNSGIPNKAAYLICGKLGCQKTAQIYYRALTTYFNSYTNFSQARLGLMQAAKDLYGDNAAATISWGFNAVGISQ